MKQEIENTEPVLGYRIFTLSAGYCVRQIEQWFISDEDQKVLFCANPHSLVLAKGDPVFQRAILDADLLTPDGAGIVLASRILGGQIRQRVTGSDVFFGLSKALNDIQGKSCFFLGSTEKTLAAIKERMEGDYPNIGFAGSYSPPFKTEFSEKESSDMVEAINSVAPDVLWVGMTAPKQEKWIFQNRNRLNVRFIGAIGAVFDFYAGNIKRSPLVFQKFGFEWLPRLLQEPRRLFKRNFVSSPLFLWLVMRQLLRQRVGR